MFKECLSKTSRFLDDKRPPMPYSDGMNGMAVAFQPQNIIFLLIYKPRVRPAPTIFPFHNASKPNVVDHHPQHPILIGWPEGVGRRF